MAGSLGQSGAWEQRQRCRREREPRVAPADSPAVRPWANDLGSLVTALEEGLGSFPEVFPAQAPIYPFPRMGKRLTLHNLTDPYVSLIISSKYIPKLTTAPCSLHHPPWSSHHYLSHGLMQSPLHWAPSFCPNFPFYFPAASEILFTFKSNHIPPLVALIYLTVKGKVLTRT